MPFTPYKTQTTSGFKPFKEQPINTDSLPIVSATTFPTNEPIEIKSGLKERIKASLSGIARGALGVSEVGQGVLKGGISTLKGASSLGEKLLRKATGQDTVQPTAAEKLVPPTLTEPKTGFESAGKMIEQVGEFLIPVGGEARALTSLLSKGGKVLKGVTQAVIGAGEFGGKSAIQTGGDKKSVISSSLLGATAPVVAGVGKALTQKLPEKLYAQIFKYSADDLAAKYRSIAKGEELNPTLAKEALERGLKGSSENMAVYSVQKLNELEKSVQDFVTTSGLSGKKLVVENLGGYKNILQTIKSQFKAGFLSKRAEEADVLLKELAENTSGLTIDITLRLRRFIDKMRNTSSFKLDPKLTPRQEEFKVATDTLRKKLADAGLKDLMNEERIFIEAIDSIVSDAVRRQNKALLGLTDVLLGGGGLAAGATGAGVGIAAGVRAFQQPVSLTGLGQGLYRAGKLGEKLKIPQLLKGVPKVIPPLSRD